MIRILRGDTAKPRSSLTRAVGVDQAERLKQLA
jgi:hypothetical protein